jgi:hypothetical protein
MVVPFKNANYEAGEDDFNFFHSQLRITVECAFGKLVHRWGILRRPLSSKAGLQKTTAMVMALCSLHNFCINRSIDADEPLDDDIAYNARQGGFDQNRTPTELVGGVNTLTISLALLAMLAEHKRQMQNYQKFISTLLSSTRVCDALNQQCESKTCDRRNSHIKL